MKKVILLSVICALSLITKAQSYNSDLNNLGQYVQRMYLNEPFEGARVVEDDDHCYLVVVVAERPGSNEYATNRKAEVKGLSYANKYLNGEMSIQNTIFHTREDSKGYSYEEIEDFIESRSMGYVQSMQVISTFIDANDKKVFVFCKQLPMPEKPQGKKNRKRK